MTTATVRDYYTVRLPGDLGTEKEILDQAVNEARERARLWCVPAEWTARVVRGEPGDFEVEVRVCRRRRR